MPRLKDYNDLHYEHECRMHDMSERIPKCCVCGEPIYQDKALKYLGFWYCEGCEDDCFEAIKEDLKLYEEVPDI